VSGGKLPLLGTNVVLTLGRIFSGNHPKKQRTSFFQSKGFPRIAFSFPRFFVFPTSPVTFFSSLRHSAVVGARRPNYQRHSTMSCILISIYAHMAEIDTLILCSVYTLLKPVQLPEVASVCGHVLR